MSPATRFALLPLLALVGSAIPRPAAAQDDVVTALSQARTAYSAKNYQAAATQLETALQLLNQLLVDQLKTFLPAPPTPLLRNAPGRPRKPRARPPVWRSWRA